MRLCLPALALVFSFGVSTATGQSPSGIPLAKPDNSSEPFVEESDFSKIVFENNGTGTRETSVRVRVQSDAGVQRYGLLTFPYQSSVENVEVVSVRVVKPDGAVIETPGGNTQDMPAPITREAPFYSDLREKHVSVKGLSVGDVLEWRVVWRVTKPLAAGEFWLALETPPDVIVLRNEVQVSLPRGRAVKWTSSASKPVITEEGNRRLYAWSSSRQMHKSDEQRKEDQAEAAYMASRGRFPSPDVQMSTFSSWEAVGSWYDTLIRERVQPSAEIRAKAAELTKSAKDEDARIRAIYNYVSTQIRYIGVAFGIGRYQPHSAAEVLSNQYGDCKDKHTLLAALLSAAGVQAYPALINSVRLLDEAVPSPGQFNHLITAVPRGGGFLWLDTTPEVAPLGYLISSLRDKRALVIPAGKPAVLVTTAADPPAPFRQTFRMEARLGETGTLEGSAECSAEGGDNEVALRSVFRRTSPAQWKDLVQLISYQAGFGGEVSDVTASSAVNTEEPLHWKYKYTRKDYSDWPNRRVTAPLPSMSLPDVDEKPTHPVWLGATGELHFESSVALPKGSSPRLPTNRELKEAFADYTATYRFQDGVVKTDRRLVVKRREVPLGENETYRKFAKAVQEDHDAFIDLAAPPRITPASYSEAIWQLPYSENLEAARGYDDARAAFQRRDAEGEIASLKRAVEVDPHFTRAWLWMGEIYKSQRKEAPALQAYRSAIKSNPREALSYHVLAFNLLMLGRINEAIATWRELTGVSAENSDAFAYLGMTLSSAKRYAEAAPALESAIKLDPQRSELSVQLGTAYIRLGEEAKAVAAFRRGLEKDPPPALLNDAAYAMAEARKQLPLALEFAEKAVSGEERASAQIALDRLKLEDVARPILLAASWDTLGWVHARTGQLEKARRYLSAAWALSQDATEGDHLGQVYERLHKPEEAARMYRLALAAGRTPDLMKGIQARLDRVKSGAPGGRWSAGEELTRLRTVKLPPLTSAEASAEFFFLLGRGAKVVDVRFISGAGELKKADKSLRSIAVDLPFPDDGPTRILRRGLISCSPQSGCSLVFYPPSVVRSLD